MLTTTTVTTLISSVMAQEAKSSSTDEVPVPDAKFVMIVEAVKTAQAALRRCDDGDGDPLMAQLLHVYGDLDGIRSRLTKSSCALGQVCATLTKAYAKLPMRTWQTYSLNCVRLEGIKFGQGTAAGKKDRFFPKHFRVLVKHFDYHRISNKVDKFKVDLHQMFDI